MRSVLKQNSVRDIRSWLRPARFSTAAALTLAFGVGATSVMLTVGSILSEPQRYPIRDVLTLIAAESSEQVSTAFRALSSERPNRIGSAPSQTRPEPARRRRRAAGSTCRFARVVRSRSSRQRSQTARCVQTGAGNTEPVPNARDTDATLKAKGNSCTV